MYQFMTGQSLGVDVDTYHNTGVVTNDPLFDHIGIHRDGSVDHLTNLAGPDQMNALQPDSYTQLMLPTISRV